MPLPAITLQRDCLLQAVAAPGLAHGIRKGTKAPVATGSSSSSSRQSVLLSLSHSKAAWECSGLCSRGLVPQRQQTSKQGLKRIPESSVCEMEKTAAEAWSAQSGHENPSWAIIREQRQGNGLHPSLSPPSIGGST